MAAHFQCSIYGMVQGGPPYRGANPFARQITFPSSVSMSFPTTGTTFHPLSQGVLFGSNYVYSIIEIAPTGLNQPSQKYAANASVTTLQTLAG